jgi:histidinol phosphatase-like enzyme (inositol monophosphatase family)
LGAPNLDEAVALAHRLADASGPIVRSYFRRPLGVEQKPDLSPVTVADQQAEAAIRDILARERPRDGIYGEEHGAVSTDAEYVWVIDPIDGTKAFVTGRPTFGTLIGLAHQGRFVVGVIDQPVLGERWVGAIDRPTLLNGRPITARSCPSVSRAFLNATTPDMFLGKDAEAFDAVAGRAMVTTYGGDCYAYGLVAEGFIDLVIEARLKPYDYAALAPVIEGAGGIMTDWHGAALDLDSDGRVVAAGDALVHQEVLELMRVSPGGR